MSASSKKKLRKEQSAAIMTEKQRDQQKENKKVKAYTVTFVVVLVAVVITALAIAGSTFVKRSGLPQKKTVAAVVDGNELNSVELSYYYVDTITGAYNQWVKTYGDNLALYMQLMGLDISKPLDQQPYAEGDTTWADYFVDQALEAAKSDFALTKMAESEGYTLTEEEQHEVDTQKEQMIEIVKANGFKNLDAFLQANYGPGSSEESFEEYNQRTALAASYLGHHSDSLTYDQQQIDAYNKDHFNEFSSYSFATYYLPSTSYLEGGTKDEDGTTTYSDEEKADALAKAKADADALVKATSIEELDKLITGLEINKDAEGAASSKDENTLYNEINEKLRGWISDSSRKKGDITAIANESETTDADGNTTKVEDGYVVVMYQTSSDNIVPMSSVRHILVPMEGGTVGENGVKTYTDEEKAVTKDKAEALLKEWQAGDATEDSFAALANDKSADTGSAANGGLIEHITSDSNYVPTFQDWALDSSRKAGDTGIVESTYGYHIMFYVGIEDLNYRDFMVKTALHNNDMDSWYTSLLEAVAVEKKNDSYLNKSFVIKRVG